MTKPLIYDCFPYFNEAELLELRLRLLYDHVDRFIITEGDLTHIGQSKPFTCVQTLQKLGIPMDKIDVVNVKLPTVTENSNHWSRERLQRDWAVHYFSPHAIHIVSDCDEIINPKMIPLFVQAASHDPHHIYRFGLAWLNGTASLRVCDPNGHNTDFCAPFVCNMQHVQSHTLSEIREDHNCALNLLPWPSRFMLNAQQQPVDCGWHFSWMGGTQRMLQKMQNFVHSGDPQQGIFATAQGSVYSPQMQHYLQDYQPRPGGHDPYGRSDYFLKIYPKEQLPPTLLQLTHLHDYFFGTQQ